MVTTIEHVREEEPLSTSFTLSGVPKPCYLPIHLLPTNPIFLLDEVNEVLRLELRISLMFTMELPKLVDLERRILRTDDAFLRFQSEERITMFAHLKILLFDSDQLLQFSVEQFRNKLVLSLSQRVKNIDVNDLCQFRERGVRQKVHVDFHLCDSFDVLTHVLNAFLTEIFNLQELGGNEDLDDVGQVELKWIVVDRVHGSFIWVEVDLLVRVYVFH